MNEQVLDEEDLRECKLHVSSVFLSCSSEEKKPDTFWNSLGLFKLCKHF